MAVHTYKKHLEQLKPHERVMLAVATGVGSTLFVIFCIVLSFTPLLFPSSLAIVQFISSSFLQLVLLPVLLIAGNLQNKHDQIRADEDYKTNVAAEREIKKLHEKIDSLMKGRTKRTLP